jgi:hypothetical protein
LASGVDLLGAEVGQLHRAVTAGEAGKIRPAAEELIDATVLIADNLWCLAAMRPASTGEAAALRTAVIGLAAAALDAASGLGSKSDVAQKKEAVQVAIDRLLSVGEGFSEDPSEAALGVPYSSLVDARGVFAPSRLLAAYYGRYGELQERLRHVLSVVTDQPPDLLNALSPAEALVLTSRHLLTLRTAVRVRALLDATLAADPPRVVGPLRELKLRVDRSAANHAGILRAACDLNRTSSDAERAALTLDLYHRMVEGQLRPWAWALLQIRGRRSGRAPELGPLRDQLLADGDPLLCDAAAAILPTARNAAAHEDFLWDDRRQVLLIGGSSTTLDELHDATDCAQAFMIGAECAWACARAASPQLAALLDAGDGTERLRAIDERSALKHFGTNGLLVRDWSHQRGILEVVLEDLPSHRINPCFQAAMWASRYLDGADRLQVTLPNLERPAMDLSRWALDATFVVWQQARASFRAMPESTFLPANAWARLAVELPDQAALAAAWLGLNDAVHAYDEAYESTATFPSRIAVLAVRLDLVGAALAGTLVVLPPAAGAPLQRVIDLVVPAVRWAASASNGGTPGPSAELEERIMTLHDTWPAASVLPTNRVPGSGVEARATAGLVE